MKFISQPLPMQEITVGKLLCGNLPASLNFSVSFIEVCDHLLGHSEVMYYV